VYISAGFILFANSCSCTPGCLFPISAPLLPNKGPPAASSKALVLRRRRKYHMSPPSRARKATGMVTPIPIFAPCERPVVGGWEGDDEGADLFELVLVGVGLEEEEEEVLDGFEPEPVICDADAKAAKSLLCHQIGMPSQFAEVTSLTELVVTVPTTSDLPTSVG
jgi:hypothetical protein